MRFSRLSHWVSLILALVLLIISAPNVWAAVSGLLQGGATLTVNVTSDEPDNLPGDGLCQTASGDCSLRAALEEANVLPGLDAIHFNLPGNSPHVILVGSPLPSVTEAVVIDGRSQPDYSDSPTVVLDGSLAGAQSSGLTITAGDSTVQGLAIHSFSYSGIYLLGRANNQLEGNYLGTRGQLAQGNQIGILVEGSTLNSIADNLISGNEVGVYLYGLGTTENTVSGNLIGTDPTGTAALGNEFGIRITQADGNLIGGSNAADRNLISGNETGIYIQGEGAAGNRIWGNYIGLDVSGSLILDNEAAGVYILDALGNLVGGPDAGPNQRGNVIAGGELAVYVRGPSSQGNLVRNNIIGTTTDQTPPAERISGGVLVAGAVNNEVGGNQPGEGNLIVSQQYGIRLRGTAVGTTTMENNILDVTGDEGEEGGAGEQGSAASLTGAEAVGAGGRRDTLVTTDGLLAAPSRPEMMGDVAWKPGGKGLPSEHLTAKMGLLPQLQSGGTTFTVTVTSDGGDANVGNGVCADSNGDCTLRAAIQEANDTTATDTIAFNIPGSGPHTIQPGSELPIVTKAIILDGTTEPDFSGTPIIEIDGSNAGAGAEGLDIGAANSTIRGLVINRFDDDGIDIDSGYSSITIQGNYIGTNVTGTVGLGNGGDGIDIDDAGSHTIGGTATGEGNLIADSAQHGIRIEDSGGSNITIEGNIIGLDINGTTALGNGGDGIFIDIGDDNTVGGTASGAGNLISDNGDDGIELESAATGNVIQGNKIGTDVSGTVDLGNSDRGIEIDDAQDNTVGGTTAAARNLISGNNDDGIGLKDATTTGNLIQGNYIGTNITGTAALGNSSEGIVVFSGAHDNSIGGTAAGAGNLISDNDDGIELESGTTDMVIQGNLIGTTADGLSALPNSSQGIDLDNADDNLIGGSTAAAGNTIAHHDSRGVDVDSSSTGNTIRANSIYSNSNLGIDLHPTGVTNNDSGDGDTGANNLQNYPVVISATTSSTATTITGTLNSTASVTFTLDFYGNTVCDSSGNGEGRYYLGSDTVVTDGSGDVSFTSNLTTGASNNPILTATATDPDGNTSEFSACFTAAVVAGGDVPITGLTAVNDSPTTLGNTTNLTATITAGTNVTYTWNFGDGNIGSGAIVSHTYEFAGTHTAVVTATNSVSTVTATTTVTITDVAIAGLTATNDSPVMLGSATYLSATITAGSNVTYTWDFDDNTTGSGSFVDHTYGAVSTYTATVTATNTINQLTATTVVTITESVFSATVQSGMTPLTVTFTNNITDATSFLWDFGDGGASTAISPTHVYTEVGTFTVVLTATRPGGTEAFTRANYIAAANCSELICDGSFDIDIASSPYWNRTSSGVSWRTDAGNPPPALQIQYLGAISQEVDIPDTAVYQLVHECVRGKVTDIHRLGWSVVSNDSREKGPEDGRRCIQHWTTHTDTLLLRANILYTVDFHYGGNVARLDNVSLQQIAEVVDLDTGLIENGDFIGPDGWEYSEDVKVWLTVGMTTTQLGAVRMNALGDTITQTNIHVPSDSSGLYQLSFNFRDIRNDNRRITGNYQLVSSNPEFIPLNVDFHPPNHNEWLTSTEEVLLLPGTYTLTLKYKYNSEGFTNALIVDNIQLIEPKSDPLDGTTLGDDNLGCMGQASADDINTLDGNHTESETFISLDVAGGPLTFTPSYASMRTTAGDGRFTHLTNSLSEGWVHNYEMRLWLDDADTELENAVEMQTPGGSLLTFLDNGDGTYSPYPGVTAELTYDAVNSRYNVTTCRQFSYSFDSNGRLLEIRDPANRTIDLTYSGSQLTRVAQGSRYLDYTYHGTNGRLLEVEDNSGRVVELTYNAAYTRLETIINPLDLVTTYTYSDTNSHLLTKVTDASNRVVKEVFYDGSGRAYRAEDGQGNILLDLTFDVTAGGVYTDNQVVIDGIAMTHHYDWRQTLARISYDCTGITGCVTQGESLSYDNNFKPSDVTDRNGHTTTMSWGGLKGSNLEQTTDALNNTTQMSYDGLNNLVEIVNAKGHTTTYGYHDATFPSFRTHMTDTLGTALFTTLYTPTTQLADGVDGLLKAQQDPSGRLTSYSYNSFGQMTQSVQAPGTSDAVTTTYGYDSVGRLITTTQTSAECVKRFDTANSTIN